MRILEELWYGNIEPTEYDTFPCAEYKEALQRISRNEEKLQATMTDAQKELLRQGRYVVPIIFRKLQVQVGHPAVEKRVPS